jgi:hypothetical protein
MDCFCSCKFTFSNGYTTAIEFLSPSSSLLAVLKDLVKPDKCKWVLARFADASTAKWFLCEMRHDVSFKQNTSSEGHGLFDSSTSFMQCLESSGFLGKRVATGRLNQKLLVPDDVPQAYMCIE